MTTQVTGTLVDITGTTWSNAKIIITFINTPSTPGPFLYQGAPISPAIYNITTDGNGAFAITLPSNSDITPAGSYWRFEIGPNASTQGVILNLPVNGINMDISSTFTDASSVFIIQSASIPRAYNTAEVELPSNSGALIYNVALRQFQFWDGTAWELIPTTSAPGGGTVTHISTAAPIIGGPITTTGTIGMAGFDIDVNGNVVQTHLSQPLTVAQGGNGTSTPSLVPGANVTITGSWPNQVVTANVGPPVNPYVPPVIAKGDLFGYGNFPDRVPVGPNGTVLTSDSTAVMGVSWQSFQNTIVRDSSGTYIKSPDGVGGFIYEAYGVVNANASGNRSAQAFIVFRAGFFPGNPVVVVSGASAPSNSGQDSMSVYIAANTISVSGATVWLECGVNIGGSGAPGFNNIVPVHWHARY